MIIIRPDGFLDLADRFRILMQRRVAAGTVTPLAIARDTFLTSGQVETWLCGQREMSMRVLDDIRISQGVTLDEIREVR